MLACCDSIDCRDSRQAASDGGNIRLPARRATANATSVANDEQQPASQTTTANATAVADDEQQQQQPGSQQQQQPGSQQHK